MKRLFLILTIFCLIFCSCSEDNNDVVIAEDSFINRTAVNMANRMWTVGTNVYFTNGIFPSTLYMLDTAADSVICLCTDPLCDHKSDECPFYGLHSFEILEDGTILMFCSCFSEDGYGAYIRHYDPRTGRITSSSEITTDSLGPEIVHDGIRVYQDSLHDEETDTDIFPLYKSVLKTGEKTPLTLDSDGNPTDFSGQLLCFYEGRYYYTDFETVYSMDTDGGDIRPLCTLSEKNAFWPVVFGRDMIYLLNQERNSVIILSLKDGTETFVPLQTQRTDSFKITENYIYYFAGEETVLGKAVVSGYSADEVVLSGGELWRCGHNGENHEKVFSFEGEYSGLRPLEWAVVGDKFYCSYSMWVDHDGDGIYRDGDNIYSYAMNGKTTSELFFADLAAGTAEILDVQ